MIRIAPSIPKAGSTFVCSLFGSSTGTAGEAEAEADAAAFSVAEAVAFTAMLELAIVEGTGVLDGVTRMVDPLRSPSVAVVPFRKTEVTSLDGTGVEADGRYDDEDDDDGDDCVAPASPLDGVVAD